MMDRFCHFCSVENDDSTFIFPFYVLIKLLPDDYIKIEKLICMDCYNKSLYKCHESLNATIWDEDKQGRITIGLGEGTE